jgi:hypothetical protein
MSYIETVLIRKIVFALLAVIIVGVSAASSFFMLSKNHVLDSNDIHQKYNETMQTMQIIVVPYFEPTSDLWQIIYNEADKHPGTIKYVIINPCSGPCGTQLSQEWKNVISILKGKGIKTLGYVFNDSENFHNIDYYMKDPQIPTDGIFFDNEGSVDNLSNFKMYAEYVHHLGGIVYINPGYNYTHVKGYIKSGETDVANIHELDSSNSSHIVINNDFSPLKISVILGNVTNLQEMQSELTNIADKGIGISYIYANSYAELPSFFSNEIQKASVTKIQMTH